METNERSGGLNPLQTGIERKPPTPGREAPSARTMDYNHELSFQGGADEGPLVAILSALSLFSCSNLFRASSAAACLLIALVLADRLVSFTMLLMMG